MKCFDCKKPPSNCDCDHPVVVIGPGVGSNRRYHLRPDVEGLQTQTIAVLLGLAGLFAFVCWASSGGG